MKIIKSFLSEIVLTLAMLCLCQNLRAAVAYTLTPAAISNTYPGIVTLQVTGLTNTETVVVQKFLDANNSGAVDAGDILVQQFQLTDGANSVFTNGSTTVTNFNVPGDTDGTANGTIAAQLHPGFDFVQIFVGNYLLVLSSPVGHFSPLTNSFSVTNFPFAQSFTGSVVSNSTPIPNAVVVLLQSSGANNENPAGGVVADNSGAYTIKMPAGTYSLIAFKSNYVASFLASPTVTLGAGASVATNVPLMGATTSISGKLVDANNSSIGLAGCSMEVQSADHSLFALALTDTNGNFTSGVTANQWGVNGDARSLDTKGYLRLQNKVSVDTTTGSVSGVTISLPKATAIFYGTVKDDSGNPLPGVAIYSTDNNGNYETDGFADTNGNYVATAIGGLGGDQWQVQEDYGGPANYIYSQGTNGITLSSGQAVHDNFTGILATNHITGNVEFNGSPVVGVDVNANATIGGVTYYSYADTDSSGNYSLSVANGATWSVGLNCNGGDHSLDNILGNGTYQCPDSQNVTINNGNGTADFTIQSCNGVQILTTSLPDGTNGVFYDFTIQAASCNSSFTWTGPFGGSLPSGLTLYSGGTIEGTPNTTGTYNFSVQVQDGNGHTAETNLSLYIAPVAAPLQITTSYLPNGTNTVFYSQTLQASGGTLPYGWSIAGYSALPSSLTLATNGVLSGTLSDTANTHYFDLIVTDGAADSSTQTLSLNIVNPPLPPLVITNVSLPNGNVGVPYSVQLGASGGQSPYSWSYAIGSINLSSVGLSLSTDGFISGIPTTNKVSTFKVQVADANFTTTNKILSIIINPDPILALPNWLTNKFQMLLIGASNQNYTLQSSTNLGSTNWIPIFITNNATASSFILSDPNATNQQRFYRVLIGP